MREKVNKLKRIFGSTLLVGIVCVFLYGIIDAAIMITSFADSSFVNVFFSAHARDFWLRWIVCLCLFLIFSFHVKYVGKKQSESEEALRQREESYLVLFAGITDGMIVHNATGLILEANESMAKMVKIPRNELIGRHMEEFITSNNAANIDDNSLMPFAEQLSLFETKYLSASGKMIPVDVSKHSIKWIDGDAVLSIFHDITDRKQAEEALRDSERKFRELSIIDDLSNLYNSRYFYLQLKTELDRSNRYGQPLTILLFDIDNFKEYNDTYGHIEGNEVITRIGYIVKRCLRETDSAYRYGGEEFTVILPMTSSSDAVITAERIRTEFKKENFSPVAGEYAHLTVSIGVAQHKPQEDMKAFVQRADRLMYQGKKSGKDVVCCES